MFKPTKIIAFVLLSVMAVALFKVKYKVQSLRRELADIHWQIESEKESVKVLNAEWAYLTKPERIRKYADKYLDLKPIKAAQLKTEGGYITYARQENRPKKIAVPKLRPTLSSAVIYE